VPGIGYKNTLMKTEVRAPGPCACPVYSPIPAPTLRLVLGLSLRILLLSYTVRWWYRPQNCYLLSCPSHLNCLPISRTWGTGPGPHSALGQQPQGKERHWSGQSKQVTSSRANRNLFLASPVQWERPASR
jgi:hypothetical protein